MYTSKILREVFNEKIEKNLEMERRKDPTLDIRLDKIEVNDSEEDMNVSHQNFYLTQRKLTPYLDTEKFFSNKSNLIHKAKQLILKEKKLKEKNIIVSESQPVNFAQTAATFYNCDTRKNNFLFRNTLTKPNWMAFEDKIVGNSNSLPKRKKLTAAKPTPYQKKTESNNLFKTMLKVKQLVNKKNEKNLCITSRSLEGAVDRLDRSEWDNNNTAHVFKHPNKTAQSNNNKLEKSMSTSASFKNLKIPNSKTMISAKMLPDKDLSEFALTNRFRSSEVKKGTHHSLLPSLKISNLNELFREGGNPLKLNILNLNFNLKNLKIRESSAKKLKMAILEIDYKKKVKG